ncbi:helix-turn-helix transcriptional regulator [Rhodothermus marinus]|uniref:helix-turn-helix transcriptional regulator n=1 Tax=Rhodothermus marinus TaxID=29549 RepID=UPI0037C91141
MPGRATGGHALRGPQILRLQRLLEWLRSGRPLTTTRAARHFEVSRRTIASDIEYLRRLGVPVAYDPRRQTYYLEEPFTENLPLIALDRAELAAFLVARLALEAFGDTPDAALLEAAVERLAAHLPEPIHVDPDTLTRTLRFEMGPRPRTPLRYLDVLRRAAAEQRVVHLHYYANYADALTERDVEPYAIVAHQSRWYLVAYCRLRQAMRDFRIDRIRHLKLREETFARRPDFDLEAYLGPAFGMHRDERTYAVHLRFSPYQARWIREEQWHPSQVLVERPDGSLDVHLQVTGLADVARWVLSYGAECEVIGPPVLRHRIASEARRMAERYGVGVYDQPSASSIRDAKNH